MTVDVSAGPAPEEHLRRFRATRDPAALGDLFDATAPALLRVALATAPDAASAENALQETFLAVLVAPERWDETRPVLPWLLGILHRQVGTVRRDGRRRPDPLRVLPPAAPDDPSGIASDREEQERVRAAIEALPEPYRQVAVLRWRHGLEPAEIADVRGEPPGTTRSLLSRALEKLRSRLGKAAFAWFGGSSVGATKGLGRIRRLLLARAAAGTAAGTAAAVAGGLAMKKIPVACVVALLIVAATFGVAAVVRGPHAASSTDEVAAAADSGAAARRRADPARVAADAAAAPSTAAETHDPDREITGRVVGPDGAPVARAHVRVRTRPWSRVGYYERREDGAEATTAKDGTFHLGLEPGADATLTVRAAGFPEQTREMCRAGQSLTIRLLAGVALDVLVVNAEGRPAADVTLSLACNAVGAASETQPLRTDAAGRARFTDALPGFARVIVSAPGADEPDGWKFSTVLPRDDLFRIQLRAATEISVHATDAATGAPLAGVVVQRQHADHAVATTGADGRARFRTWAWTEPTAWIAASPGYAPQVRAPPTAGPLEFALSRGFTVSGRAVTPDGTPIAGARCCLHQTLEGTWYPYLTAAAAGSDGRFTLDGATLGAARQVAVGAPGLATTIVTVPEPSAEGFADVGDVVVAGGRRVTGTVTDSDGHPLAGVQVGLSPRRDKAETAAAEKVPTRGLGAERTWSDDAGAFRFDAVAPGAWTLWPNSDDAPRIDGFPLDVAADADPPPKRLAFGGSKTLALRVVDDLGAPVVRANVQVAGEFGQIGQSKYPLMVETGIDGRASVRALPAGPVQLFAHPAWQAAYVRTEEAPTVEPDGSEITLVLHRAVKLSGHVRDLDGRPLAALGLESVRREDGVKSGFAETGADGSFTIWVPAGAPVDLRLNGSQTKTVAGGGKTGTASPWHGVLEGLTGPLEDLELRAAADSEADRALDKTLTVVVVDSSGVPVDQVEVHATFDMKGVRVSTDEEGRAVLKGLPGTKCRITFWTGARMKPLRMLDVPPVPLEVVPSGQEIRAAFRAGAEIRGRLRGPDGKPIRGMVQARGPEYTYTFARAGDDGRFVIAGVAGKPHVIEAEGWIGTVEASVSRAGIVPGAEDVELTLAATARNE